MVRDGLDLDDVTGIDLQHRWRIAVDVSPDARLGGGCQVMLCDGGADSAGGSNPMPVIEGHGTNTLFRASARFPPGFRAVIAR